MTETTTLCTSLRPLGWLFYMFTSEVGRCKWMRYEGYSRSIRQSLRQPGPKSDNLSLTLWWESELADVKG